MSCDKNVVDTLLGNVTVQRLGPLWTQLYLSVVIRWALLNGASLAWHFIGRRDHRAIDATLGEAYAPRELEVA